jgi:hypothetical protein
MPLTDRRTTRRAAVDPVADHGNQLEVLEPPLRPADSGGIHGRQDAQVMGRTGLVGRKRHHDAPFGHLKTGILHHALKHAARDDGQLEGQEFAEIEGEGLGLVFHAAILSVVIQPAVYLCAITMSKPICLGG